MNRYLLEISYNGLGYFGWQVQSKHRTIQGELQECLSTVLSSNIKLMGAGRTDAGVHAIKSFAHFDYNEPFKIDKLKFKLNRLTSDNISINSIIEVSPNFHARFSAVSRTYEYWINFKKDPFLINRSFFYPKNLNLKLFNEGCSLILGEKDFSSFCKSKSDVKNRICNVTYASCILSKDMFIFKITANRFLHNMVRSIVGTLIDYSSSKIKKSEMINIILKKDRKESGFSVPAHGLYLVNVEYPKNSLSE